jgi:poly(3-hydroxybutyrate) depolymerase
MAPAGMGADAPTPGGALSGTCPDGFTPKAGMNSDFPSGGKMRTFHVSPPANSDGPAPMFVALTGTVQEELSFTMQAGLNSLPGQGWIVVSPVRSCSQEGRNCSTTGMDGRVWEPWFDGTAPRSDEAGPDVEFVEAMVRCVASMWPTAANKIYTGGISAGGSFSNRNLTFNSKLFAGGVPASGNWTYGVPPATAMQMDPSIVIIVWGGPNDTWPGSPPYAEETKAAAEYYAAQPDVVTVACSGTHGHAWPTAATPWLIETLLSHPKGTDKASFMLKPPAGGLTCVLGAYTDH